MRGGELTHDSVLRYHLSLPIPDHHSETDTLGLF